MGVGVHRREEIGVFYQDLLSPLRLGTEAVGKPEQVVSCRAGDEERRESKNLKLAYLLYWPTYSSGRFGCWIPRDVSCSSEL